MAISHVLSSPIADFTGTVTVFNSAGQTTTVNATQIVRPSDWNSAHNQFLTISGNTAGTSTLSGTNIVLAGGNNVTLSGSGSTVSIVGPTQTAFVLSNSNGLTFGTNGSTVTASHNGLTTAAQSDHSHGNPTLALTNISGTTASASNGLTLSLSANAPGAATLTAYAVSNTTQSTSGTIPGSVVSFQGNGGVSVGVSNGSVVVSGPALTSLSVTGALSASSNGSTISLGVGTVTASAIGNTTQTSSGTINLNGPVFSGAGGVSVGYSNGTIILSGATGGGGGGAESNAINLLGANTAGNTTASGTTIGWSGVNLTFSGTNGSQVVVSAPATSSLSATGAVSLSTNGSTISIGVGTVTANAASNTTQNSTGTVNLNAMTFQGAGIASVGLSNGSVVISVPSGGGAGDGVNILAAGTQTAATTGTVLFSNSNGITFGMSNSSIITASHNGLTTARASNDAIGLNTAATNVTWTVNSSGLSLNASGYAGTATAISGGALITLNSAGLSFNGNALAGTGTGFTGGASISGSMTHNTAGLSLSLSHPAWITTQSGQAFSAGGGSSAFQTLSFNNANGATFTNTNGSVGLSYSVPVVSNAIQPVGSATGSGTNVSRFAADDHVHEGVFSVGVSTGGNTAGDTRVGAGRFVLAGGANITLSQATAAGGLNTISIVGGAGGGGAGLSAGTQSVSTGTVVFSDSNGISFGMSGSSRITASYNSTQFAGTGTTFAGANISASMTLNSNGLNLSASVAAPGAAAENNAHNLLGANTAGNTTATGSTIGLSGVNITLSGTNASQIVISAPATSSLVGASGLTLSTNGSTISVGQILGSYIQNADAWANSVTLTAFQSTSHMVPFFVAEPVSLGVLRMFNTNSVGASSTAATTGGTTFSYGHSRTHNFVIYSRGTGASSLSLQSYTSTQHTDQQSINVAAAANSTQFSYSNRMTYVMSTGTSGVTFDYSSSAASLNFNTTNMTGVSGNKIADFPFAMSLTPGLYWLAYGVSSSTASQFTNQGTRLFNIGSVYGMSQPNLGFGFMEAATNSSAHIYPGLGSFSTAGGGTAASVNLSAISTSASHNRMIFQLSRVA